MDQPGSPLQQIRRFWDDDAATYDRSPGHRPTDPDVLRAWGSALAALLPPPPARVLDVGAGTGFLSLLAARAGHRVTALDLSPAMLGQLERAAASRGLSITTVTGPADILPPGDFDAVMERHLLWTLPDPGATLSAWRSRAARLVLVESLWGGTALTERLRATARWRLRQLRRTPPDHHGEYPPALRSSLPLGSGTPPAVVLELVRSAGWSDPRIVWLKDLRLAERRSLPFPERLLGPTPRFAVTAR
ncbi:MAG TPA: class I SAM-dependent methyltransferase [Acidimicrobiales bacterium]|nr:class I SAM-dependent methyltransferase [Acidimicrobiales bacterium]